tara:strand:- start:84 stop:539 length:456 start_codon:yes stop_codon:yes gene_type:complete
MIINLNKNENFEFKKIKTFREFVIRKNVSVDINFWKVNKSKILKEDNKNIGITINSDQSLDDFIEHLYIFKMICINFLTFKDGRPFTFARKLREYYNFKKLIRASGHIIPDQSVYLIRSGFNSFDIDGRQLSYWKKFMKSDVGLYYQKVHI